MLTSVFSCSRGWSRSYPGQRDAPQEQYQAAGLKGLWVSSHLCLFWLLKTSTVHRAIHSWKSLNKQAQCKCAACLSHAWINPSLTSYWLRFFSMPACPYREEAPHPHKAVGCNQPWKTIYQSPSFVSSWLTKLLHALTLPLLQAWYQQRWRTWGTENGCCDSILK